MTSHIVFQAFLFCFVGMATVGSAQNRDEPTRDWNPTRAAVRNDFFPADGNKPSRPTAESPELFPADRPQVRIDIVDGRRSTLTRGRSITSANVQRDESIRNRIRPLLLNVSAQPSARGADPKVPPAPKGTNPVPMPMGTDSPTSGVHGPTGYSVPMGVPIQGQTDMMQPDQVFNHDSSVSSGCCSPSCCNSGCNSCCDSCCGNDWCRRCWWFGFRSTCDMPQHFPYPPEYHGYYYFRPYNYFHVLQHQQIAPLLGADPIAPYETTMFQKIYVEALGKEEANRESSDGVLKPLETTKHRLPDLEELLANQHDIDDPRDRSKKSVPPKPGIGKSKP